jgi:hypothetical protein
MPNQRAKNKSLIGAFVDSQLKLAVTKFARQKGITTSDVLNDALKQYLERSDPRSPDKPTATGPVETQAVESTAQPVVQDEAKEVWLL